MSYAKFKDVESAHEERLLKTKIVNLDLIHHPCRRGKLDFLLRVVLVFFNIHITKNEVFH